MVLLLMLAFAYSALRKVPKSPFCTLNISLMERILLEALSSLSLLKRVEVNMISWHVDSRDMTSSCCHHFLEPEDGFFHVQFS